MQRTTNTTSACSSCKHQRKKCTDKCILAPFFPVTKTVEFQAVHKVFGVSNVTKIVRNLKEEDRKIAVDSLVWEALCRQKDPVLGPYGDYRRVCEELRLYKNQFQQFRQHPITQGTLVYKPTQGLTGWTNNNVMNNNNDNNNSNFNDADNNSSMTNVHINGDTMMDFYPFSYNDSAHNIQDSNKFIRPERQNESSLILPQQYLPNAYNQQYFLTGKYNPMDLKSMESTIWEGSS
ncbi:LOB domain-containing protein 15 [Henckelia pumila]|uniref:LOB domain-containing protein 15 n=1 Tax=Henckelia pumila TaxID=405737 RepID=UPI003C6E5AC5